MASDPHLEWYRLGMEMHPRIASAAARTIVRRKRAGGVMSAAAAVEQILGPYVSADSQHPAYRQVSDWVKYWKDKPYV